MGVKQTTKSVGPIQSYKLGWGLGAQKDGLQGEGSKLPPDAQLEMETRRVPVSWSACCVGEMGSRSGPAQWRHRSEG